MKIHKEGYRTLMLVIFCLVVINVSIYILIKPQVKVIAPATGLSLLIFIYFLQFFRNPQRDIITDPNTILAPADGSLVVVEEAFEEEYLNEKRLQVSIFMSPYNVHSNRSPVSGTVSYVKYHPGKFLVAWLPKSSTLNERSTIVIKCDNGVEILIRQIAGAVARRIITYPKVGDIVIQGEEIGFIKFGSRVDMYLPLSTKIEYDLGTKVKAGLTQLTATFGMNYNR